MRGWFSSLRKAVVASLLIAVSAVPLFAQTTINTADPGTSETYHPALVQFRVGYYFQLQGDHERAIEEFSSVISAFPDWAAGYSARGDSYAALEQYELAIIDYNAALALEPGFVSVLYMRGRAFAAQGEPALAEADYTNAVAQMPEFPLPYWGLGDLYYDQGNMASALAQYELYLALTSESPDEAVIARVEAIETLALHAGA